MAEPNASRILGIVGVDAAKSAQPGVPPYHTPVFVPAHPRYPADGSAPHVDFELLRPPSGPPVPVAFSTLPKLVGALGPMQPWIALSLGPFTEAMREARLPKVRLDPEVAQGGRRWRAEDLERTYGEGGAGA
ncbi:SAV_915 family protein [Streptomyces sp. NPDC059070]|uniref:SAV_915 family protein n=1 Tax=unclassified Streptomyces TaxID=2593676 RepID=UPI0034E21858